MDKFLVINFAKIHAQLFILKTNKCENYENSEKIRKEIENFKIQWSGPIIVFLTIEIQRSG